MGSHAEGYQSNAPWLPLSVWASKGFDPASIEQHSRACDKRLAMTKPSVKGTHLVVDCFLGLGWMGAPLTHKPQFPGQHPTQYGRLVALGWGAIQGLMRCLACSTGFVWTSTPEAANESQPKQTS